MNKYKKNVTQLKKNAAIWWPTSLSSKEADASIIPLLLETQDKFVSILNLVEDRPFTIFKVLQASNFPSNLFLKHLVVLTDFGGEKLQRLNKNFDALFPKNKFTFFWKETKVTYRFKKLPLRGDLTNAKLSIDGKGIIKKTSLDDTQKDVIALLLFGSTCPSEEAAKVLYKCEVGTLLGQPDELESFIKQRYIVVSRITSGAKANALGQIAQTHVVDYLKDKLGKEYKITRNGTIEIKSQKNQKLPFDIVVQKDGKNVGIEVSFQVTTNSTIERKAGQARDRAELLHKQDDHIAYIIDGAGNFQRSSAIGKICENSDCTLSYKEEEFELLVKFLKETLND